MSEYLVIDITDLEGKLSPRGEALFAGARRSVDGTKVLADIRGYPAGTLAALFASVDDFAATIQTAKGYTLAEAKALMQTPAWLEDEI